MTFWSAPWTKISLMTLLFKRYEQSQYCCCWKKTTIDQMQAKRTQRYNYYVTALGKIEESEIGYKRVVRQQLKRSKKWFSTARDFAEFFTSSYLGNFIDSLIDNELHDWILKVTTTPKTKEGYKAIKTPNKQTTVWEIYRNVMLLLIHGQLVFLGRLGNG